MGFYRLREAIDAEGRLVLEIDGAADAQGEPPEWIRDVGEIQDPHGFEPLLALRGPVGVTGLLTILELLDQHLRERLLPPIVPRPEAESDLDAAHAFWLERYEEIAGRLRDAHADPMHLNPASKELNSLREELQSCEAELFRVKHVRAAWLRAMERQQKP